MNSLKLIPEPFNPHTSQTKEVIYEFLIPRNYHHEHKDGCMVSECKHKVCFMGLVLCQSCDFQWSVWFVYFNVSMCNCICICAFQKVVVNVEFARAMLNLRYSFLANLCGFDSSHIYICSFFHLSWLMFVEWFINNLYSPHWRFSASM